MVSENTLSEVNPTLKEKHLRFHLYGAPQAGKVIESVIGRGE